MDWIKKNTAQFALIIFALVLLGVSVMLIMNAQGFQETFAGIRGEVRKNNTLPPVDAAPVEEARAKLDTPAGWSPKPKAGSFFVSEKYILKDGVLTRPLSPGSPPIHPPVPNDWFAQHQLEILDMSILEQDPDGDGFTNLEEWTGNNPGQPGKDSTDPQNKNSRPPLLQKLRLVQFISRPFRLLFNAYDGNPAKPQDMTFQINTVDVNQPTQFKKIGEQIDNTKFKVMKFELKNATDPSTGTEKDVSELTVQNTETGVNVVLVMEQTVNSPDSFAKFRFLLDGSEFAVKKDQNFSLKAQPDRQYKLVDINEAKALIEDTKTGEKIEIPKADAKK